MRLVRLISAGIAVAGISMASVLASTAVMAQASVTWDMPNEYGPKTVPGSADAHFGDLVKDTTKGMVQVVNQYGGAISVKSRDMLDAVSTGAIPIAHFPLQAASGLNEIFLVSNLPFLAQTVDESATLQKVIRPHIEALLAEYDAELLYFTTFAPVGVWSEVPLTTLADYKGLRLRTNDPVSTKLFQALGAAPLQISWADMLPQLQTGAISAVHTSTSGGVLGQLWDKLPIYNDVGTYISVNAAVVSKTAMAALPPEVQKAVREAGTATQAWARDAMLAAIDKEVAAAESGGAKIIAVSDLPAETRAAYIDAAKPIIADWLSKTGERGKAIIDAYSAETGKKF